MIQDSYKCVNGNIRKRLSRKDLKVVFAEYQKRKEYQENEMK